jgi:hypothetical protein
LTESDATYCNKAPIGSPIPSEQEPTVRVVIFLPLRKAQLLDQMKYLMKVDKSDVVEKALDEAIRTGTLVKIR